MFGDCYRDMSHQELKHAIATAYTGVGAHATKEQVLPNGCRADVMVLLFDQRIIFECKTEWRDNYLGISLHKYGQWCDYLIIATPPSLIDRRVRFASLGWRTSNQDSIGLIEVSWEGVRLQHAPTNLGWEKKQPALRRAVSTLRRAVIGSPACPASAPYHDAAAIQIPADDDPLSGNSCFP